jgi:2-keto-4-pentenoate hydratase/2-oxohepta-3-ene-1,7-dioic acid hydratase in catechol pathway
VKNVIGLTGQWFTAPRYTLHSSLFAMLPTRLLANGEDVEIPAECRHIHREGDLVIVIDQRTTRFLAVDEAPGYVFGMTVGNDVADQMWYREQSWSKRLHG